ncbi:MAG TPA: GNAT family N-acetyltransferase, partial [Marmoricola sp.]|nr:GNAT family N-acetyltransferase [Marmoricola sp.]
MDIELRAIDAGDVDALQALVESDSAYVERVTGHPPGPADAQSLLLIRPPALAEADKVVLGAWEGDDMVGVVDLLRRWPDPDTVHVGLLQVHGHHQGRGLGRVIHDLVLDEVHGWPGVSRL